ncbi:MULTISPECIES: HsdM family class I SAM-dependent methyltransferase [Pseudomonas]|nr:MULTISPECIES: N-6 DNA methylase [Pseudomonas]PBJ17521.1 putative type I restriction enzymeP M protein [Pseudomonas ogarae]
MALDAQEISWYASQINKLNSVTGLVADTETRVIIYPQNLKSDESLAKSFEPEELVHALAINLLASKNDYSIEKMYHEQYFAHGSGGSLADEVDLIIYDEDDLPYAVWEFKSWEKFKADEQAAIKYQLFGTAPLIGAPKLLVYASIQPRGEVPVIQLKCIDYTKHKSYESWLAEGSPHATIFPKGYQDLNFIPYILGSSKDLKSDTTQADFRAVANGFHNEFFGEHADNALFINLVKCLLAKIYDERTTKSGCEYQFQIKYRNGTPQSSAEIFNVVNKLYAEAYSRYIEKSVVPDEIDPKEFSKEKVKSVVLALESLSLTKGAALHGDIIGAFFEEILRVGFKQDKGMYFTHSNLVKFIIEAIDVDGLTKKIWAKANHPENRLPYVIDPASGSGAFLLQAMNCITSAIKNNEKQYVSDFEEKQFYAARMSDETPNYWAENFVYGFDPKFIMAITAKVNMVLHGDGSAHMFKYDAFKPFTSYNDSKLRIAGDLERSLTRSHYPYDLCETFDIVLSNPPFGVTLSSDTKRTLKNTFSLPETLPSEALFIERAFQLLKPGGRLGVVLPESIFNAIDLSPVRIFLYRMFKIKAIVSLPRNVFIDTPTLTSLLFAEKKLSSEISAWDEEWQKHTLAAQEKIRLAKNHLQKGELLKLSTAEELQNKIANSLNELIDINEWIYKKGKNAEILPLSIDTDKTSLDDAVNHYKNFLASTGLSKYIDRYAFKKTIIKHDISYHSYMVNEVGYKLSKRKEKAKPNQLACFKDSTGKTVQNLHLCEDNFKVHYNITAPSTVLDYIKRDVQWSI